MTAKQLLALVVTTTITFVALLLGGGYVYQTAPELLGISRQRGTDSLPVSVRVWEVELDRLERDKRELEQQCTLFRDSIGKLHTELSALRAHLADVQQQLVIAQQQISHQQQRAQRDSLRLKNLAMVAEMYDRADPAEVAKILASAESSYAASVLRLMKRKTAAKVIEYLPKDKALAISLAVLDQP